MQSTNTPYDPVFAAPTSPAAETPALYTLPADTRLADRYERFCASMLDLFVVGLGGSPGLFLILAVNGRDFTLEGVAILISLVGMLGVAVYNWVLIARAGQTIGKRLMGIKIVRRSGAPVGFFDGVVLRTWVVPTLNSFVGVLGLIDALMIIRADRRCLHDHIAGTIVIATPTAR